jgi:hypothetical protein
MKCIDTEIRGSFGNTYLLSTTYYTILSGLIMMRTVGGKPRSMFASFASGQVPCGRRMRQYMMGASNGAVGFGYIEGE